MEGASRWDAICVGAGITSLAFGAQVVKRHPGARILVIDKHGVAGGYATVFQRPKAGAAFDCSLHKLSGMGDGGNLRRIFADLGLDKELGLKIPADYFEACLPGGAIRFGNGVDSFRQALLERFPHERAGLHRFFDEVAIHGRNGYHQFQMMDGTFEPDFAQLRHAHKHLKHVTVADALAERVDDPWLREILAATGIYVGGFPEDLGYPTSCTSSTRRSRKAMRMSRARRSACRTCSRAASSRPAAGYCWERGPQDHQRRRRPRARRDDGEGRFPRGPRVPRRGPALRAAHAVRRRAGAGTRTAQAGPPEAVALDDDRVPDDGRGAGRTGPRQHGNDGVACGADASRAARAGRG